MTHRLLFLLPLLACQTPVQNPTGSCEAADSGARSCYHAPAATETYLPHCDAPLERELWRVFAIDETTAYMIPRPDATGLTFGFCAGDDAELADLFDRNGLCVEIADPSVVNSMTLADAMAINHALHERLVFTNTDGNGTPAIRPWAPDGDIADACALITGDVPEACEWFQERRELAPDEDCSAMAWVPDAESVDAIVPALNALYGIPDDPPQTP